MKKTKARAAKGKQFTPVKIVYHHTDESPYNEKDQMKAYKMLYNQEERELMGVGSVIRSIANVGR